MEVPPTADGSPYQEYVLTKKGQALFPVLVALGRWGSDFLYRRGEQRSVSVDVKNGRPLRRVEVRSEDGRLLGSRDTLWARYRRERVSEIVEDRDHLQG
jgi:HxlR-like helix-turn-helix